MSAAAPTLRVVPPDEAREVFRALGMDNEPTEAPFAVQAALLDRFGVVSAELVQASSKLIRGLEAIELENARHLDILRVILANVRLAARHGHESALELPTRLLQDLIARLEARA